MAPGPKGRRPFPAGTFWCSVFSHNASGSTRSAGSSRGATSVAVVLLVVLGPVPSWRRAVLMTGVSRAFAYACARTRYGCVRRMECKGVRLVAARHLGDVRGPSVTYSRNAAGMARVLLITTAPSFRARSCL